MPALGGWRKRIPRREGGWQGPVAQRAVWGFTKSRAKPGGEEGPDQVGSGRPLAIVLNGAGSHWRALSRVIYRSRTSCMFLKDGCCCC